MLFSVIVPIYNIENYLKPCIDSVLAQSFADYELILVDDGSLDRCGGICDEYAKVDPKIKVIHKENGGLVSARQAGIRMAKGDYVVHLDGDDALCPDALESAEKIITETHAEIIGFSYRRNTNGKISEVIEEKLEEGLYNKDQIREHIYPKLLGDRNMQHMFYFVWGKAIKRELATKHQLRVNPQISLGEDLCCIVPCYLEAQSVYFSKKDIYRYTIRNTSLTKDFKPGQISRIEDVVLELRKIKENVPLDWEAQISRYSCYMCFAILASAAEGGHFKSAGKLKALILNSVHKELIQKAQFDKITIKSRITIFMMKRQWIFLAFYFLRMCKHIKQMRKGGRQ